MLDTRRLTRTLVHVRTININTTTLQSTWFGVFLPWQLQICYRYVPRSVVQKYISLCSTCQLKKLQSMKAPLKPFHCQQILVKAAGMCWSSFSSSCVHSLKISDILYRSIWSTCSIFQTVGSNGFCIVLTTGQSSTFSTHWNRIQLPLLLSHLILSYFHTLVFLAFSIRTMEENSSMHS